MEPQPAPAAVWDEVERILASPGFVRSVRMARFLRFVVDKTLRGQTDELKESILAIAVFDRSPDYDSRIDSVVRVEARRLRQKLRQYYQSAECSASLILEIPEGTYVPRWLPRSHPRGASASQCSVAVLPFANLSSDPEQDYFCDGITDEIIHALSRAPGLDVVARSSTFQFKNSAADVREVGERLGASLVVEGAVRKAADRVRITSQIVNAHTGYQVSSRTLDGALGDVFAIEERIAQAVSEAVREALGCPVPNPPSPAPADHLDAFTLYLKGRHHWNRMSLGGFRKAEELFRLCLSRFPEYARAYAGLADCYCMLATYGAVRPAEAARIIREAAGEAIARDPLLAEPYNALGGTASFYEWNWREGARYFRQALALQPGYALAHHWYAMHLAARGRLEEAEEEMLMALRLDPLSPDVITSSAIISYYRQEFGRAAAQVREALDLDAAFPPAWDLAARASLMQGRCEEAIECFQQAAPRTSQAIHLGWCGGVYARWGRPEMAAEMLRQMETLSEPDPALPFGRALVYTGLADLDNAFACLARAVAGRVVLLSWVGVDPYFTPLRQDARFAALRREIGLEQD